MNFLRAVAVGAFLGGAFSAVRYPDSGIATAVFSVCMYAAMVLT